MTLRRAVAEALLLLALTVSAAAQAAPTPSPAPQNPSPMVEHTRVHPRLTQITPPGRREKLELGTLFLPEKLHSRTPRLLFFFHGGDWLPDLAAAGQKNMAAITVQAGAGSGSYTRLFVDPKHFPALIAEAEAKSGLHFSEVDLAGWSAGCGALRQILLDPAGYDRVHRVLCIDGVHTDYTVGTPGPLESKIGLDNLKIWQRFGADAIAGKKRLIITHTEIFPGTFASTTETSDELLREWGLTPHPVAKFGPMQTQMLSDVKSGGLEVLGFAGNSAPDHVDQLHSLPVYLRWLTQK
jgi:hypothetical protein